MNLRRVVKRVAVVDDTRVFRNDFVRACCDQDIDCDPYASGGQAREALLGRHLLHVSRPQIVFIDCSLISQPPGEDVEGVLLAQDLCKSRRMKGAAIYMYTKFLCPVPDYEPLRTALAALLEQFRESSHADLSSTRRVVNLDIDDCLRDISELDLLQRGRENLSRLP